MPPWGRAARAVAPVVAMGRAIAAAERFAPRQRPRGARVGGALASALGTHGRARGRAAAGDHEHAARRAAAETTSRYGRWTTRPWPLAAPAAGHLRSPWQALRALGLAWTPPRLAPLVAAAAVESVAENLGAQLRWPTGPGPVLGVPVPTAGSTLATPCWAITGLSGWARRQPASDADAANWAAGAARGRPAGGSAAALEGGSTASLARAAIAGPRPARRGWPMSAAAGARAVAWRSRPRRVGRRRAAAPVRPRSRRRGHGVRVWPSERNVPGLPCGPKGGDCVTSAGGPSAAP